MLPLRRLLLHILLLRRIPSTLTIIPLLWRIPILALRRTLMIILLTLLILLLGRIPATPTLATTRLPQQLSQKPLLLLRPRRQLLLPIAALRRRRIPLRRWRRRRPVAVRRGAAASLVVVRVCGAAGQRTAGAAGVLFGLQAAGEGLVGLGARPGAEGVVGAESAFFGRRVAGLTRSVGRRRGRGCGVVGLGWGGGFVPLGFLGVEVDVEPFLVLIWSWGSR